MIGDALESGTIRANTAGRLGHIFEYDFGRQIGVDLAGNPATRLRVVRMPDGTIKTAFPFRGALAMVTLDYRLSPGWRAQAAEVDLRSVSAEALHYDLFLGDVIFRSNGADFSAPWDWVPVLDFAMSLLRIAREVRSSASQRFEFTESEAALDFERHGDQVQISSSYSPGSVLVPYEDLQRAAEEFAQKVVREVKRCHPLFEGGFLFRVARLRRP